MESPANGCADGTHSVALSDRQRVLLQKMYDHFHATGTWPRYRRLEVELRNQGPLHEILASMPGSLYILHTPIQRDSLCALTLRGLAHCEGAQEDIDNFVRSIALLARWYLDQHGDDVKVHSDKLASELGLAPLALHRVIELLWRDSGGVITGGGRSNDGTWSEFTVGPGALHFIDTSSLDDFFEGHQRAEKARRSEAQLSALPGWKRTDVGERIVLTPPEGFIVEGWSLHPAVVKASSSLFMSTHYAEGVRSALQVFEHRVQQACVRPDLFGKALMAKAFAEKNPLIRLNPLASLTDLNDQEGVKFVAMGIMVGLRNIYSHGERKEVSASEALEQLVLLSILFRRLDTAGDVPEKGAAPASNI